MLYVFKTVRDFLVGLFNVQSSNLPTYSESFSAWSVIYLSYCLSCDKVWLMFLFILGNFNTDLLAFKLSSFTSITLSLNLDNESRDR